MSACARSFLSPARDGPIPFIAKIVRVIFNMDRMVGTDFEVGLANMKALAGR
jgi:hypothetical protein